MGRWRALSPIYQVAKARHITDFLLLHSGQGNAGRRAEFAESFAKTLRAAGAGAEIFDGTRYSHAQINRAAGRAGDVTAAIDGFITTRR